MAIPTKTLSLIDAPADPETALAPSQPDSFALMVERLASNPNVDVAKLEKLLDMQERILDRNAKAAFEAAYAQMQAEIPEIDERGRIAVKGVQRSTYAKLEDIHAAVKPILKKFGFAIRHRTEFPEGKANIIRIVGILGHAEGHSEESAFEAPMDRSDYRTDIQSMGSTVSYGRRYTTLDLLNISTRGMDNDGQARTPEPPKAPAGFDNWWTDLQAVASSGHVELEKAWKATRGDYRKHLVDTNNAAWEALKRKAAAVKPVTA